MSQLRIIALLYLTAVAFFGWGLLSVKLEIFPHHYTESFYQEVHAYFSQSHQDGIADLLKYDHQERASQFELNGIAVRDREFKDAGYLLLARYDKAHGQTLVEFYSLSEDRVLHTWVPDLNAIFAGTPLFNTGINTKAAYRSQHPLLLPDGDIIIGSGEGPLVRVNRCGELVWAIERHFHHSIEMTDEGNLLVPVIIREGDNELGVPMRDDGFALVSPAGEILMEYSLYDILMKNGYRGLIYGVGEFEQDRFHLNDVQPVPGTRNVLLSIRNLSSVASLNLDTGNINWLQTGPWINQHDVNVLADGRVSVFGNDFARGAWTLMQDKLSQVYVYDPRSGEVSTPYTESLQATQMHSEYEGRSRILGNGDVFIEETNRDRLLRLSPGTVRWEYVNGITATTTGALHWSRYLDADTALPIGSLENSSCGG